MTITTYLGLIGLSGIAILILIYIIKPNYQQKHLSSTFIWRLSLKYAKKSIPFSRIRNIIIFICQILILCICSFMLTQPFIAIASTTNAAEKVIILDASASMRAVQSNGKTRFNNAVEQISAMAKSEQNGVYTLILAGGEAGDPIVRVDRVYLQYVLLGLSCGYGEADINDAINFAESFITENPAAKIILYTATTYHSDNIEIVNLSQNEWNVAITDFKAQINSETGYYILTVNIKSSNDIFDDAFGDPVVIRLYIEIYGANGNESNVPMIIYDDFTVMGDETVEQVYEITDMYSFRHIRLELDADDSFALDNEFYLYGGVKDTVKILYASSLPNAFFDGVLAVILDVYNDIWAIDITETKKGDSIWNTAMAGGISGYDLYIFEHNMPVTLPTDGAILLVDPDIAPQNSGLLLGNIVSKPNQNSDNYVLSGSQSHTITASINPSKIEVSRYTKIKEHNGYLPLLNVESDPVLLIKDEDKQKIAVLAFDLHYSNLPMRLEFPALIANLIDCFFPPAITEYVFDVNQPVKLSARASLLNVVGAGLNKNFSGSVTVNIAVPGVYTITQTPISGRLAVDRFFIKIAESQSDFNNDGGYIFAEYPGENKINLNLLVYLAAALLLLVLSERLLQNRDY